MKLNHKYLILLVIFCFSGLVAAANAPATIEAIGGSSSVLVKREGKGLRLKQGDVLVVGDEVDTDKVTAVDIRLEDQTILRIGVNSSYRLAEDSKVKQLFHKLLSGIVRVLVPAKKDAKTGDIRFRMGTPEGTIGVRGTEFVVIRGGNETKLKGLTGEVLFGPADSDFKDLSQFVLVTKGYESSIKQGQKPLKPAKYPLSDYISQLKNAGFSSLAERSTETRTRSNATSPMFDSPKEEIGKAKVTAAVKTPKFTDKVDLNGQLMKAVASGNLDGANDGIRALIKKGANPNYRDNEGNTLLHMAAVTSQMTIMQVLIDEENADVDAVNKEGRTPLMLVALESGETKPAMTLVQNDADTSLKDKEGRTALDIAQEMAKSKKSYEQLVQYLQEHTK